MEARRAVESLVFKDKSLGEKLVEHGESKDLLSEKFNKGKAKKKMPKGPVILTQLFQVTLPPDFLVGSHGSSLDLVCSGVHRTAVVPSIAIHFSLIKRP